MRPSAILAALGLLVLFAIERRVASAPPGEEDPTDAASYVGAKSCKRCHIKLHKGWAASGHEGAFQRLPEKFRGQEDEKGRACISCHVTGWGAADRGGFVDIAKSEHLLGVQCEACHGPGSRHVEAAKALEKANRKEFGPDEKKFIDPKPAHCTSCHNPHDDWKGRFGEDAK